MPLLPSPSTAALPHLRLTLLPLPLPLPHSLLRRRASHHHPRLLPAAASLPPPPPDALLPNQATCLVAASQANFMRVIVGSTPPGLEHHSGADLLCVVRALLKKIRRRVLVGDRVLVGAVDWTDRRGMIEDVFERRSEVTDPPVANVDQLVVLFSMDQPQPEPATLTRFLVEAESTGIPFVLVFNKLELVDEQWRRQGPARPGPCPGFLRPSPAVLPSATLPSACQTSLPRPFLRPPSLQHALPSAAVAPASSAAQAPKNC